MSWFDAPLNVKYVYVRITQEQFAALLEAIERLTEALKKR